MKIRNIALIAALASLSACSTVDSDERGVFTSFGSVEGPIAPGLQFYNILTTSLEVLSVAPQKWDDKTTAYTSDFQNAEIQFTVTYNLKPEAAKSVWVAAREEWSDRFVPPLVQSSIKQVIGKATAIGLIQNRADSEQRIKALLSANLAKRGIAVSDFSIRDVAFSKAFESAVERKQVAVENAQAAKNRTAEIEENARQKIITAEADAKAMQIKSAALSANPGLANYEAVQKWNGVLPQHMMGGAIPFVNIK